MSMSQLPDDIFYEEKKHWYNVFGWIAILIAILIMMPFAMLFAEICNWHYSRK
jgi:hypothetical protein